MLAEAATLSTTNEAGDIHLCRRLCEGEVGGAQTDAGVWAEHLLGKRQEDLLEVGERNVLVDIEAFHLMEETVGTGSDSLIAIDTTRTDNPDGSGEFTVLGVHVFHHTGLNRRGVRTEQNVLRDIVGMLRDEEGVLHVAGRMVGSEVHLGEHVEVVFHLRAVGKDEPHA